MASDSKRVSVGARVATPRVGSAAKAVRPDAGPSSAAAAAEQLASRAVGAQVRIETSSPARTVTGYIFAISPSSPVVTLTPQAPATATATATAATAAAPTSYTVIGISSITSLTVVEPRAAAAARPAALPAVDGHAVGQRAANAVAKLHAAEARKGKGVTREAQQLFDALHRTLPVSWDGPRIVVLGSVVVAPPYAASDCRSLRRHANMQELNRVKKVVESERKKLAAANGLGAPQSEPSPDYNTAASRPASDLPKGG